MGAVCSVVVHVCFCIPKSCAAASPVVVAVLPFLLPRKAVLSLCQKISPIFPHVVAKYNQVCDKSTLLVYFARGVTHPLTLLIGANPEPPIPMRHTSPIHQRQIPRYAKQTAPLYGCRNKKEDLQNER